MDYTSIIVTIDLKIETIRIISPHIPGTFWIDRLDVSGKMVNIEEENVGIAGATSRLSDEESGHFPTQIPVKFNRFGYTLRLPKR